MGLRVAARHGEAKARKDSNAVLGETENALARVTTERDRLEIAWRRGEALRLGALSSLRLPENPGQALLLGIEALELLDSPFTREALWNALG
jgi:hypothetical protein